MHTRMQAVEILHLAVRILTLPPIVIGVTLLLMYALEGFFDAAGAAGVRAFLLLIPIAAYPLREILHIGKDRRKGQRATALVCSAVGYIAGFLWSLLAPCSWLVHILFLSYVISIAGLLLLNVGLGFHASGHACSTTAPALLLTWKLHPLFIIPSVLLIVAVYRSSSEAVASHAAPAPDRLGGEPPGLWDFHPVLRNRLRQSLPLSKRRAY